MALINGRVCGYRLVILLQPAILHQVQDMLLPIIVGVNRASLCLGSGVALADGHALWPTVGSQTPPSTDMMEGKTGNIMHLTSSDVWNYAQAPDGWPTMVTAACHNSVLMLPNDSVAGGIGGCESIDYDGDASVWYGEISPTFGYDGKPVAGTGEYQKWSAQDLMARSPANWRTAPPSTA